MLLKKPAVKHKNQPMKTTPLIPILALVCLSGCVTNPNPPPATKFSPAQWLASPSGAAFSAAVAKQVAILIPIAEAAVIDYLNGGGKISNAQAAQIGAYAASAEVNGLVQNQATKAALTNAIATATTIYSGDPKFRQAGTDIARLAVSLLPANPTPQQVAVTTSAVGVAINSAITGNAPPN